MSNAIWAAASGAIAQLRQLDATANNVANASTLGYRADTLTFREVLGRANNRSDTTRHCTIDRVAADPTPGALLPTGRPLDVALTTPGYLVVNTADGERYTRVGTLTVGPDRYLRTGDGHQLLDTGRKPIQVEDGTLDSDVQIGSTGGVVVHGSEVAQLLVVRFPNDGGLRKSGGSLFAATEESGRPTEATATFANGVLEGSNVSAVAGMVDIVHATRAFEACQRVMDTMGETARKGASSIMSPK